MCPFMFMFVLARAISLFTVRKKKNEKERLNTRHLNGNCKYTIDGITTYTIINSSYSIVLW